MIDRLSSSLLCFFAACVLQSCTQQRSPCYEPKLVSVSLGTYRLVDTSSVDTSLPYPLFACVDTPLLQEISPRSSFQALLSPHADSTRWLLMPDSLTAIEDIDTITFYHSKRVEFISNACGYVHYFTLQQVNTTHHGVDSVSLINNSVDNNANTQHIRIYY